MKQIYSRDISRTIDQVKNAWKCRESLSRVLVYDLITCHPSNSFRVCETKMSNYMEGEPDCCDEKESGPVAQKSSLTDS